ncbi:MAG: adenylosuccinate synthetase, partial [Candidatus Omnitrophica bacterium]|nr:adenylosuccinate synthetase [Candidatus Omnitrophota bacterium]
VCTAYKYKGKPVKSFPYSLDNIEPVYREFKGWRQPVNGSRRFIDLPKQAQDYVIFIEKFLGVKVSFISVGKKREAIFKKTTKGGSL